MSYVETIQINLDAVALIKSGDYCGDIYQTEKTFKNSLTDDGDFCRIVTMSRNAIYIGYWWRWPVGFCDG